MSRSAWLSPGTSWRGVSRQRLRRDDFIWLVWAAVAFGVWALLGNLMFRFRILPDESVLLLLLLFAALVVSAVALLFDLARCAVSFLVE